MKGIRPASGLVTALFVAVTTVAACGGVSFNRADGTARYKKLSMSHEITVAPDVAQFQDKYQLLGTLEASYKSDAPAASRDTVIDTFSKVARRRGCDALVGLKSDETEGTGVRREKVVGANGKVTYKKVQTSVPKVKWSAWCVRTAAAPGGLKPLKGEAATNSTPEPAPDPTPAPVAPEPTPTPVTPAPVGPAPAPVGPAPVAPAPAPVPTVPTTAPAPTPVGAAVTPEATALWASLGTLKSVYLSDMKDSFKTAPDHTMDTLVALGFVLKQVVTPDGFWRKTVPTKWFGCKTKPTSDPCTKLTRAAKKLQPFEAMLVSIDGLNKATAGAWLTANNAAVVEFLRDYVPASRDLTGMKSTPFFKRHFAL